MPREVASITKRAQEALTLLFDGTCRTVKAAAERKGMSREHLSAVLHSANGRAFIEREMRKNVATAAMRASNRLHELVDSPSQTVAFDATRLSLGIAGIKPDETSRVAVSVDIKAGYILDLRTEKIEQDQRLINSDREPMTLELPNNQGVEPIDTKQQRYQGVEDQSHSGKEATPRPGHRGGRGKTESERGPRVKPT